MQQPTKQTWRDGWYNKNDNRRFLEAKSKLPGDDDGNSLSFDALDDGRSIQVTPAVKDVAADFNQLVTNAQLAVLGSQS